MKLPILYPTTARTSPPAASFYLLASITVSFLAGSAAPTPLYPVYQSMWGFSPVTLTLIFGIYAVAVLAALLVAGRLSDHLGRRPVLIAAAVGQVVVMLMFATAASVTGLLLARVFQGITTGAAIGAVGAAMIDLDKRRGSIANAVVPPLGTALGCLIGGVFLQYLPGPTHLVFAVLAAVFVAQVLGLAFMKESITARPGALESLMPRFNLPRATRKPLLLAAADSDRGLGACRVLRLAGPAADSRHAEFAIPAARRHGLVRTGGERGPCSAAAAKSHAAGNDAAGCGQSAGGRGAHRGGAAARQLRLVSAGHGGRRNRLRRRLSGSRAHRGPDGRPARTSRHPVDHFRHQLSRRWACRRSPPGRC